MTKKKGINSHVYGYYVWMISLSLGYMGKEFRGWAKGGLKRFSGVFRWSKVMNLVKEGG